VSVTAGVLVSNGVSVTDQSGGFADVSAAVGYSLLGGGISTASGTNAAGKGINTTIAQLGVGVGTPSFAFGSSNTTVITDPQLIQLYRSQFADFDPFATGSSLLAQGR
jgi:hypothetical protein